MHELCETQLPELRGDELVSLKVVRVTSCFMVMTPGKDGAAERVVWGDVDMTFVGQDMVVVLPV